MIIFLLLFILALVGKAEAVTRYVDSGASGCATPSDNDYNPATRACGSGSDLVYSTVNAAKNAASGGDDIFVRGNGTVYAECITDPPNGTASKDTYLGGYQSERPILRPSVSGCGGRVIQLRADANVRRYIQIDNLDIDGSTANVTGIDIAESSSGVSGTNPNNIKITGNIIRSDSNSCIFSNGANHFIARNFFDTCGATDRGHGIYSHGVNEIVERNEFVGMVGYAWQYYCSTGCTVSGRGTFRYNVIRNGQRGALASIAPADIYGNVCFNNSHSHGCARASRTGTRIYNNVAINQSVGVSLPTSGHFVRNNILLATTPISDSGTNTKSNNITTGVASDYFVDPPTSGTDLIYSFALISTASTAIDQGTATIASGLTLAFNGSAPDIGAHERFTAVNAEVGAVNASTVVINFGMDLNTPVQVTNTTGWTSTCGTISTITRPVPTRLHLNLASPYGGGGNCAVTYNETTGNARDSALIGNSINQRLSGLSSFTVTDNTGGAPSINRVQSRFRFEQVRGTEAAPVVIAAENTSVTLPKGAAFRLRIKIRTDDNPVGANYKLQTSKDGAAYSDILDTMGAALIAWYGGNTDPDIVSEGTTVTEQLTSDEASNISCSAVRSSQVIPTLDFNNSETECLFFLQISNSAAEKTTYDFRIEGLETYTVTPRVTVGPYVAGSGF